MLQSMTGFGAAQAHLEGVEYAVEIRSVNNRYFKPAIKLPEIWSAAECEIEKLLRLRLSRGSIALTVRMKISDERAAYSVNTAALAKYINQLKMLEMDADPTLRIDLGSLLQLPGVCEPSPLEELCRRTHDALMELIGRALEDLVAMRGTEGEAVQADLAGLCNVIEENLAVVAQRAPRVVVDYQARLAGRVAELTNAATLNIDAEYLAREVAVFAERCDVAEEVSRLAGHLGQFRQAMQAPELAGRKLDFIAQEMLREANTMASKANDGLIARAAVEMKTAIDRIKEQVQNVE